MTCNSTTEPSTSAFGCRQGVFEVDRDGQATYRLPIPVPTGAGHLQPQLELAYHHRQGNGILGVGWSVGGLSAIHRVKATYAVDGFNGGIGYGEDDRLALDGQRLINVDGACHAPGTVYYTERHAWKHVRAGGPDAGFVVTLKNGHVWRYGCTPDSRILALGGAQVRVWALHSIEDLNGNRVEFQYTTAPVAGGVDEGAYYLERIRYTVRDDLAPNRFVDFDYEERPDPIATCVGGHAIVTRYRLKRIGTRLGADTQVRSYAFDYASGGATGSSRLRAITETGAVDAGAPTLPPIRIDWQDTGEPGLASASASMLDRHPAPVSTLPMDLRGCGRSDLAQLWRDGDDVLNATCYLASGAGADVVFTRAAPAALGRFPLDCQAFPVDLDGDGRTDLLVAYRDGASGRLMLAAFLSNGAGFDPAPVHDTGDAWSDDHLGFFAMDVNGDGRTDLVEAYGRDDPAKGRLLTFRSYLSRFGDPGAGGFGPALVSATADPAHPAQQLAWLPMDVDGDGMVDLVRVWRDGAQGEVRVTSYLSVSHGVDRVAFSASKESRLATFAPADQLAFLPADVNGDGMMDLVQVWREPVAGGAVLHLGSFIADGRGGFVAGPDSAFPDRAIDPQRWYPMDLTGDGHTQLLGSWTAPDGAPMFTVFAPTPSGGFRLLADVNAGPAGATHARDLLLVGDVDGDGKADLIRLTLDDDGEPVARPCVFVGFCPDLVSAITDQLGAVTSIRYAPLSDPAVYRATTPLPFPARAALRCPGALSPGRFPVQAVLRQAIHVVAGYTRRNDPDRNRIALAQEYACSYTDAALDMLGRGWLGFAQVATLDLKTGLRVRQCLNQAFPLTGTVAAVMQEADGRYSDDPRVPPDDHAVLLSQTTSSYQVCVRAAGATPGAPAQPVFEVLLGATQYTHYDYGGAHADYATGYAYAYDDYGNKVRDTYLSYVDPATGEPLDPARVVHRYNRYRNDVRPDGWALGYLCWAKVSSNPVDAAIDTFLPGDYRLERRTYLDGTYQLASHGQWDNTHGTFVDTAYAYDRFGNRTMITLPGGAIAQYSYEQEYRCYLQYTLSPPNAEGKRLSTLHGFDPRFGLEVALRDENGAVFITALDGFGRARLRQGPVPARAGLAPDANALSPLVTGDPATRDLFLAAAVCTLQSTDYGAGKPNEVARKRSSLQSFATGTERDVLDDIVYADPLGREVLAAQAGGRGAGDTPAAPLHGTHGKPLRKNLPYQATRPGPLPGERYRYDAPGQMTGRLQPDAPHRFTFELGRPPDHVDPTGESADWIAGLFVGLVAVAGGIAIVATGGAALGLAPGLIACLGAALVAAGAAAVGYPATHTGNFRWTRFGLQVGIAAGAGALIGVAADGNVPDGLALSAIFGASVGGMGGARRDATGEAAGAAPHDRTVAPTVVDRERLALGAG